MHESITITGIYVPAQRHLSHNFTLISAHLHCLCSHIVHVPVNLECNQGIMYELIFDNINTRGTCNHVQLCSMQAHNDHTHFLPSKCNGQKCDSQVCWRQIVFGQPYAKYTTFGGLGRGDPRNLPMGVLKWVHARTQKF